MVIKGLREGGDGEELLNRCWVSFRVVQMIWNSMEVMVAEHCECP